MDEILETALRRNIKLILLINKQLHEEVKDLNLHFAAPSFYFDKEEACRYQCFDMFTKMLGKKQKRLVGKLSLRLGYIKPEWNEFAKTRDEIRDRARTDMVLKFPCKAGKIWHWKEDEKGEDGLR